MIGSTLEDIFYGFDMTHYYVYYDSTVRDCSALETTDMKLDEINKHRFLTHPLELDRLLFKIDHNMAFFFVQAHMISILSCSTFL